MEISSQVGMGGGGADICRALHDLSTEWGTDHDLLSGPINGWSYSEGTGHTTVARFIGGAYEVRVVGDGVGHYSGGLTKDFDISIPPGAWDTYSMAIRLTPTDNGGAASGDMVRVGPSALDGSGQLAQMEFWHGVGNFNGFRLYYKLNQLGTTYKQPASSQNWLKTNVWSKLVGSNKSGIGVISNINDPTKPMRDLSLGRGGASDIDIYGFGDMTSTSVRVNFYMYGPAASTKDFTLKFDKCFLSIPFAA